MTVCDQPLVSGHGGARSSRHFVCGPVGVGGGFRRAWVKHKRTSQNSPRCDQLGLAHFDAHWSRRAATRIPTLVSMAARLDGADVEWTVGSHSSSVDRLPSPSHRPKAIASVVTAK